MRSGPADVRVSRYLIDDDGWLTVRHSTSGYASDRPGTTFNCDHPRSEPRRPARYLAHRAGSLPLGPPDRFGGYDPIPESRLTSSRTSPQSWRNGKRVGRANPVTGPAGRVLAGRARAAGQRRPGAQRLDKSQRPLCRHGGSTASPCRLGHPDLPPGRGFAAARRQRHRGPRPVRTWRTPRPPAVRCSGRSRSIRRSGWRGRAARLGGP
jgi:hypothetical protein